MWGLRRLGSGTLGAMVQTSRRSSSYAAAMYDAWAADPAAVHPQWAQAFEKYGKDRVLEMSAPVPVEGAAGAVSAKELQDHLNIQKMIRAYRVRGHSKADLNPLTAVGEMNASVHRQYEPGTDPEDYGFTEADHGKMFELIGARSYQSLVNGDTTAPTLSSVVDKMQKIYCGKVGYQYKFIEDEEQLMWIQDRIEHQNLRQFTADEKRTIMERLIKADGFERFMQKKYGSEKRFGVDGCEILIPGMNALLEHAASQGAESAVIGMPHRGRLNTLINVMNKPLEALFYEFSDHLGPDDEGMGDVKYHLGMTTEIDVKTPEGSPSQLKVSLMANPSHLEAVNPVLHGKVRAKQDFLKFKDGVSDEKAQPAVFPILLHGDAAFAGQGVVFECFGLTHLNSYTTGGTIHVVVNNQVGFTTDPRFSRSTEYCTDIGRMVGAPIVHVNADSPEDVIRVFEMAADYRQRFHNDFVIDLVCYRRFGHNEGDQPMFTQPRMYQLIERMTPIVSQYRSQLVSEGVIDEAWAVAQETEYMALCDEAFKRAAPDEGYTPPKVYMLDSHWQGFKARVENATVSDTGVDYGILKRVGAAVSTYPEDFKVHRALKGILKKRFETIENGAELDWATGEALAFGSLLLENNDVRLSGQDVERGTFSQRHHVLHDQEADLKEHNGLAELAKAEGGGIYSVSNSHLSEYAVLGFELGYAQHSPYSLVCWEAQFGDFANTAQCIIDQFIVAGEDKWGRQNGLVMLLPHGYEGMGPEHSSCRLERFLQMCDDDESVYPDVDAKDQIAAHNIQVVNATTPANYFHVLRRQVHRDFRKPLIIATPKSLLRHPDARSTLEEMGPGTRFKRVIPETDSEISKDGGGNPDVRRVVLCSGKVYYDLLDYRRKAEIKDVAIARVEQISPFPFDLVDRFVSDYPNADVVWCQEEPKNMGAWGYVRTRIETALTKSGAHAHTRPAYRGRKASAATATGGKYVHPAEQTELIEATFNE
mmetsp:Transcript_21593/g.64324  ORF Transcript_21593/g.64324 Transcript_21593/m.64324 type:complete len:987 (-) Transcript_21593:527-3487(-)